MSQEIIKIIVEGTNKKAKATLTNQTWIDTDVMEIYAFIGLLLISGANHEQSEPLAELWITENVFQRAIYPSTITRERFKALLRFIRFDDLNTRAERQAISNFTPLDIFFLFL